MLYAPFIGFDLETGRKILFYRDNNDLVGSLDFDPSLPNEQPNMAFGWTKEQLDFISCLGSPLDHSDWRIQTEGIQGSASFRVHIFLRGAK